jgi:hypothetical protein
VEGASGFSVVVHDISIKEVVVIGYILTPVLVACSAWNVNVKTARTWILMKKKLNKHDRNS